MVLSEDWKDSFVRGLEERFGNQNIARRSDYLIPSLDKTGKLVLSEDHNSFVRGLQENGVVRGLERTVLSRDGIKCKTQSESQENNSYGILHLT